MKASLIFFVILAAVLFLAVWLGIANHIIFWFYMVGLLFMVIGMFVFLRQEGKLSLKNPGNTKNYLAINAVFLTKSSKKKIGLRKYIVIKIFTLFSILQNLICWPVRILLLNLKKEKVNQSFLSINAYFNLYPTELKANFFIFFCGLILITLQFYKIYDPYAIVYAFVFGLVPFLALINNLISPRLIIETYKSSLLPIKANALLTYLLLIANLHIFCFLILNFITPAPDPWALLNLVKNELVGINTLNTLFEGEIDQIKRLSFQNYALCVVGLCLKAGVISQIIISIKATREEKDIVRIAQSLLLAGKHQRAHEWTSQIPPENLSNYLELNLASLVTTDRIDDAIDLLRKKQPVEDCLDPDYYYFLLISLCWKNNFSDTVLFDLYKKWIHKLENDGMFAAGLEMVLPRESQRWKLLQIIEDANMTEMLPISCLVIEYSRYDSLPKLEALLQSHNKVNSDRIVLATLYMVQAIVDEPPGYEQKIRELVSECVDRCSNFFERQQIYLAIVKIIALNKIYALDPELHAFLEASRSKMEQVLKEKNELHFSEPAAEMVGKIFSNVS